MRSAKRDVGSGLWLADALNRYIIKACDLNWCPGSGILAGETKKYDFLDKVFSRLTSERNLID